MQKRAFSLDRQHRFAGVKKPLALKVIAGIAWLALGAGLLLCVVIALAALIPPGTGVFAAFLDGVVESLGYDRATFGAYEAGREFGVTTMAVAPALALLLAARSRRRLWLLRATAILWAVVAAANGVAFLPVVASALSFVPSVGRYYQNSSPRRDSADEPAASSSQEGLGVE